jgi:predicted nuclease with TOPRIM domain
LTTLLRAFESRPDVNSDDEPFSVDALVDRIEALVREDEQLVRRLVEVQAEVSERRDQMEQVAQAKSKADEEQVSDRTAAVELAATLDVRLGLTRVLIYLVGSTDSTIRGANERVF